MDLKDLQRKFRNLERQAPRFMNNEAPYAVAVVAENHFRENFQNEGFEREKWPEVNRRKDYYTDSSGNTKKNYAKGAARMRPILTGDTGDLGRSIEASRSGSRNGQAVVEYNEYGQYHNEGGPNLPQRKFAGQSDQLNQLIADEISELMFDFFNNTR